MLTAMSSKTTKQDTTVTIYRLVTKEENTQIMKTHGNTESK